MKQIRPQFIVLLGLALLFLSLSLITGCNRNSGQGTPIATVIATPTPIESEGGFSTKTIENTGSGKQFRITKIEYVNQSDLERVILTLDQQTDGDFPGYKVEELGQEIRVLLYDTRDVDENFKNVFTGDKSIAGSGGNVVKTDLWYPEDDSMIGAKIHLAKTAGFRVVQGEDPLRLIIEIEKN